MHWQDQWVKKRKRVTTTNFTKSKFKNVFLVHHYYDNQNVKKNNKIKTMDVLILPMVSKRSERRKSKTSTIYGILPMVSKACGGLGKGQLG